MINVEFLIVTYIVSLFVDWVFQADWQASNKSKWSKKDDKIKSASALLSHSFVYACLTTIYVGSIIELSNDKYLIMFIVLFISHAIIDTRIPVKLIMLLKGMTPDQIKDTKNYGFMHIGIDHRLHESVILILAILFK